MDDIQDGQPHVKVEAWPKFYEDLIIRCKPLCLKVKVQPKKPFLWSLVMAYIHDDCQEMTDQKMTKNDQSSPTHELEFRLLHDDLKAMNMTTFIPYTWARTFHNATQRTSLNRIGWNQ